MMCKAIVGVCFLVSVWLPPMMSGDTAVAASALATLNIKDPIIHSAREMSKGTLTVAQHFGLSPKWLDPQEQGVGTIGHAFLALVHDALIKPTGQGYFTYSYSRRFRGM